jgi:HlyD family secretion protein
LLLEELQSLESLNEKQLVAASKLLGMKRAVEECKGHVGKIDHEISKNLEAITEDQSHITKTISDHFKDIYKELRQVQDQVLELNEQYRTVIDLLGRMEIKSPVDGYVTSLAYHTIGGVITPGTKIMEIVPKADKLIVEVKVNIRDIENIHVGQYSKIQLSAYKSKLVPRLSGTVTYVSADKIQDYHQNGGQPYYIAKVEIDQEELKNVNYDVKLVPGMPAEVYIVKGTRTMLQLLLSPLIDSFHKAFKEA